LIVERERERWMAMDGDGWDGKMEGMENGREVQYS